MRIITVTAFTLELNIANTDQPAVQERVNGFIDKYTKKFLKQLYGDVMGGLFVDALTAIPPIQAGNRFYDLAQDEDLQTALASYVYYWYMRDGVSFSSGQGEKRAQASNSTDTEMGDKVSRAWNEMVDYCRSVVSPDVVIPSNDSDFRLTYPAGTQLPIVITDYQSKYSSYGNDPIIQVKYSDGTLITTATINFGDTSEPINTITIDAANDGTGVTDGDLVIVLKKNGYIFPEYTRTPTEWYEAGYNYSCEFGYKRKEIFYYLNPLF